jgi:hypothetical protein
MNLRQDYDHLQQEKKQERDRATQAHNKLLADYDRLLQEKQQQQQKNDSLERDPDSSLLIENNELLARLHKCEQLLQKERQMQGARFDGDELKGRLDGMGKQFTDIC